MSTDSDIGKTVTVQELRRYLLVLFSLAFSFVIWAGVADLESKIHSGTSLAFLIVAVLLTSIGLYYKWTVSRFWWLLLVVPAGVAIHEICSYTLSIPKYPDLDEILILPPSLALAGVIPFVLWPAKNSARAMLPTLHGYALVATLLVALFVLLTFLPQDMSIAIYALVFLFVSMLLASEGAIACPRLTIAFVVTCFLTINNPTWITYIILQTEFAINILTVLFDVEMLEGCMPWTKESVGVELIWDWFSAYRFEHQLQMMFREVDQRHAILEMILPIGILLISRSRWIRALAVLFVSPLYVFEYADMIGINTVASTQPPITGTILLVCTIFLPGSRSLGEKLPWSFKRAMCIPCGIYILIATGLLYSTTTRLQLTEEATGHSSEPVAILDELNALVVDWHAPPTPPVVAYHKAEAIAKKLDQLDRVDQLSNHYRFSQSDYRTLLGIDHELHSSIANAHPPLLYDDGILFELALQGAYLRGDFMSTRGPFMPTGGSELFTQWENFMSRGFDPRYAVRLPVWEHRLRGAFPPFQTLEQERGVEYPHIIYRAHGFGGLSSEQIYKMYLLSDGQGPSSYVNVHRIWVQMRILRYRHETGYFPETYDEVLSRFGRGVGDLPDLSWTITFQDYLKVHKAPGGEAVEVIWELPPGHSIAPEFLTAEFNETLVWGQGE